MGIPVLFNPFAAERLTRQRLLNAVQQTGDYNIMSQQVLMTMTVSTLTTKTLLPQCHKLKNAPCLIVVKTVLQVAETWHSHTEVSSPRVFGQVIAEIGPTH